MSRTYGECPDYSHGLLYCLCQWFGPLPVGCWFTCCGGDVLIGCSQMLSGGSTNFMALCYSVIRLVIINHCVMKHPNTNRATWFMLSSSVIKALKVSDTTQPNTGAPAPQDRTQPSGYIYRGYSSEDSCACVLAGG